MERVVIAMDSFKGSLTAAEACRAVMEGVRRAAGEAECDLLPVADGGEGTVDAVVAAAGGEVREIETTDPIGRRISAKYAVLPDGCAVIETAAASGLTLLKPDERDARRASSYGTGLLVRDAIERGARKIILGLGGSATTDGGSGLARALGARYLDADGIDIPHGGAGLASLDRIDTSDVLAALVDCSFVIAADVKNVLCGPEGAAAVFGPQKGASPDDVRELDAALARLAEVMARDMACTIASEPGSGAAGGMICGLAPFTRTETRPGIDLVLDLGGFDTLASRADLVITGEGRIDSQSAYGKVPAGVARRAKAAGGAPVIAIGGSIGDGAEALYDIGADAIFASVAAPMTLDQAMRDAGRLLADAAERAVRALTAGRRMR